MEVVVPFAVTQPKTRLSPLLDDDERRDFARAMLEDVLAALRSIDVQPRVLADRDFECESPVIVDDRPLTDAVNAVLPSAADDDPTAVVMADLALVDAASLSRLVDAEGDVVLVPGRGGGTNALLARAPEFRVDYHGASIRDHRRIAREAGLDVRSVDSFRLSTDIDEPSDLVEVVLHGDGAARDWLVDHGFEVTETDGRVDIRRNPETI